MTEEEILRTLAEVANQRKQAEELLDELKRREHETIAAGWRAKIPPTKLAKAAQRTPAHVRNLRPEDVPPARLGGNAAPQKRRRKIT